MNEPALNLDEFVDPETGEILETENKIVLEDLPKIARSLQTQTMRMAVIKKFRDDEVARITAHCDRKTETLQGSFDYLLGMAKTLMAGADKKRLEYPGLGVLKFGTTRESVDTSGYDDLPDEEQEELQADWPSLFRIKTTVSPDKKAIMATIREGAQFIGFKVNEKRETFIFKAEL